MPISSWAKCTAACRTTNLKWNHRSAWMPQTRRWGNVVDGRPPAAMKGGYRASQHACQLAGGEIARPTGAGRPSAAGGKREKQTFHSLSSPWQNTPAPGSAARRRSARVSSNNHEPRRVTLGQPTDLLTRQGCSERRISSRSSLAKASASGRRAPDSGKMIA